MKLLMNIIKYIIFLLERDADNAIKFLKVHIEKGLEHALALFKEQV